MNHQQTKKIGVIINQLVEETFELVSFWNDTAVSAAKWELENDYEDTCYDTEITIHGNLTATVLQLRKGYSDAMKDLDSETMKKITEGEVDIDNVLKFKPVMDHPPDPNLPYDWADSINQTPNSKIWELSKHEVSKCLTEIILPFLDHYLAGIDSVIEKIKKLRSGGSITTVLDVLSAIALHSEHGRFIIDAHREYELFDITVTAFQDFAQECTNMHQRLKELVLRFSFEIDLQSNPIGRPKSNETDFIEKKVADFIAKHPDWYKSKSRWKDMAEAIDFNTTASHKGPAIKSYLIGNLPDLYKRIFSGRRQISR